MKTFVEVVCPAAEAENGYIYHTSSNEEPWPGKCTFAVLESQRTDLTKLFSAYVFRSRPKKATEPDRRCEWTCHSPRRWHHYTPMRRVVGNFWRCTSAPPTPPPGLCVEWVATPSPRLWSINHSFKTCHTQRQEFELLLMVRCWLTSGTKFTSPCQLVYGPCLSSLTAAVFSSRLGWYRQTSGCPHHCAFSPLLNFHLTPMFHVCEEHLILKGLFPFKHLDSASEMKPLFNSRCFPFQTPACTWRIDVCYSLKCVDLDILCEFDVMLLKIQVLPQGCLSKYEDINQRHTSN